MKQASIDLGTNTCLLLIKETNASGEHILHDESNVVRLGQGVALTGRLDKEAMERARACLRKYADQAKAFGIASADIYAVATAQARDATNANEFFDSVAKELGIRFRVLSGEEEAKATFLGGNLPEVPIDQMVVLDIGGGSTELVAMPKEHPGILGESLHMGAVKLSERFLKSDPVTDDEFWACEAEIDQQLQKMKLWRNTLQETMGGAPILIAVAGTAVTLAMMQEGLTQYDRSRIDGARLTQGDAHRLVEELKWRTVRERQEMVGMESKRADVILAGALIFWRVMEELNFKEVFISTRGLRYGVFKL